MNPQIKDHFYDQFLKEPTKDNFRDFMKKSCGELNEMDFKETWIDKGPLAKIMLAMANNGGGIIIFGVKENEDNTFDVLGLDNLKDTADISNSISRLVSSSLDYEVSPVVLSGTQFTMGGIILTLIGVGMGGHLGNVTAGGILLILYLAMVSAVAYTLWSVLLAWNDVSKVAIFGFVNPLCSVILSALVLGEVHQAFNAGSLIALLLVCVGIYVVNRRDSSAN